MAIKYITRSKQGIKSLHGGKDGAKHTACVTVTTTKTMELTYYSTEPYHGYQEIKDLAVGVALGAKPNDWVDGGTKVEVEVDTEDLRHTEDDKAVA